MPSVVTGTSNESPTQAAENVIENASVSISWSGNAAELTSLLPISMIGVYSTSVPTMTVSSNSSDDVLLRTHYANYTPSVNGRTAWTVISGEWKQSYVLLIDDDEQDNTVRIDFGSGYDRANTVFTPVVLKNFASSVVMCMYNTVLVSPSLDCMALFDYWSGANPITDLPVNLTASYFLANGELKLDSIVKDAYVGTVGFAFSDGVHVRSVKDVGSQKWHPSLVAYSKNVNVPVPVEFSSGRVFLGQLRPNMLVADLLDCPAGVVYTRLTLAKSAPVYVGISSKSGDLVPIGADLLHVKWSYKDSTMSNYVVGSNPKKANATELELPVPNAGEMTTLVVRIDSLVYKQKEYKGFVSSTMTDGTGWRNVASSLLVKGLGNSILGLTNESGRLAVRSMNAANLTTI